MSESILQPPLQALPVNSPMVDAFPVDPNFKPGGEMVTIMGAPEGDTVRTMTEAPSGPLSFLAPTQNITREYIPLSSEFDPYAFGAGSYSPLFFRNIASRTGPTTSAVVSSAGSGDGDWISSLLAPGTPGAGTPSTGSISRDFEAISNTPGLLNALLALASGPTGIASVAAGTLLSNVMGREQVSTLGEAIKNALMDQTLSAEDRARLQETQRGLNRVQEQLGLDRVGITQENLPATTQGTTATTSPTTGGLTNIGSTTTSGPTTLTPTTGTGSGGTTTGTTPTTGTGGTGTGGTGGTGTGTGGTGTGGTGGGTGSGGGTGGTEGGTGGTGGGSGGTGSTGGTGGTNAGGGSTGGGTGGTGGGTTDTANEALRTLINSIYSNELGRTLGTSAEDQAGLQYWLGQAANKTPEELARDIRSGAQGQDITSVQNRQEVRDLYDQLFNRAADTEGLNYWAQQAATKSDEELRRDILSGASAADRAEYENRQEVRDLYQNLFNRPADEGGLDYWSQQAATKSPEELARDMLSGASQADKTAYNSKVLDALQEYYQGGVGQNDAAPGPTGQPGTGNIAVDFVDFVSEPAVQNAVASLALGAVTGPVGPAIGNLAINAIARALAETISNELGLDKALSLDLALNEIGTAIGVEGPVGVEGKEAGTQGGQKSDPGETEGPGGGGKGESTGGGSKGDPGESEGPGGGGKGDPGEGAPGGGGEGPGDGDFYQGGLVGFAQGGVIPLVGGGKIARGPGGGLDDLIPTTIDGKRAAALSDGEFVIPADVVSMMGDGSTNAGSKRLYDLVRQIRENKTGTSRQAGPLPIGDILKRSLG